jgi:hypothetical protein
MGLTVDLKLQGNDFSNVATFCFVGLLCFEIPNSKLNLIQTQEILWGMIFPSSPPLPFGK